MVCIPSLIAVAAVVVVAVKFLTCSNPEALFGTYRKDKGRWYYLKFCAFYLFLQLRKWKYVQSVRSPDASSVAKVEQSLEEMDRPQVLSDHPKAIDAVFFNGASRDGHYFVAAFARRPKSVVDGFVFLRIPGLGLFQAPRLPDTRLLADDKGDVYSGEGILIEPIEPMRHWRVSYEGKMRKVSDPDKLLKVKVRLDWRTQLRHFDFNVHTSPIAMAKAIARESWSKEFFKKLEESHQNHYEQMGSLEGVAEIEGEGTFPLRLQSMRDHSYCFKREWKHIHRYIIHYVTVEDGTRFMMGLISMPISISVFECGYLYTPSGTLVPADWSDMPLWYLGENGEAPRNYGFSFGAGGQKYEVQVEILEFPELFIGEEWEARVLEGMCKFTVNGKKGWGFAEWDYNYHGGRDKNYSLVAETSL